MMKKHIYLLLFAALLTASCAGPQFFYDYDRKADFSEYKSYDFYSEMKTGLSELDAKRVMKAIDSTLAANGMAKSDDPDFKINFYASFKQRPSGSRIGLGIGGGGGNVGVGVSGGIPIGGPDTFMVLTIEFVEWPSNVLFWQTAIESRFYPNMKPAEKSRYFQNLISEALTKYPPGTEKE